MQVDANPDFFVRFNESVIHSIRDPLPQEGKVWEVAKRVATIAAAAFVYLAMAIVYAVEALVHVIKKLANQQSDTPLEGFEEHPIHPQRPDVAPQTAHISTKMRLTEIINDHVCGSIPTDFGEKLENGDFVAVDILLNITIGNAAPHLRHLHVKNNEMRDAETIQGYIREIHRDMNYLIDHRHRSNSLSAKWLILFRDTNTTYSYSQRDYVIHDDTRTTERGGVSHDLPINGVAQTCLSLAGDLGFPQTGTLLRAILLRNENDDYHELHRI